MRTSVNYGKAENKLHNHAGKLWQSVDQFVNNRERAYLSVHPKRLEHFEAISALRRMLSFNKYAGLNELCTSILKHEGYLRRLVPSQASRYYKNAEQQVSQTLRFCNEYLNQ
ncbi:MAG: hypothetical protein Q8J69_07610 [Sphingobacteriaceae bacterium]|nr:hypothetical protein [Sphingobacteriaceae bacterium]